MELLDQIKCFFKEEDNYFMKQGLTLWEPLIDDTNPLVFVIQLSYISERPLQLRSLKNFYDFRFLCSIFQKYEHQAYLALWALAILSRFDYYQQDLQNLTALDLRPENIHRGFSELPSNIEIFHNVRVLILRDNVRLSEIESICQLNNLVALDLYNCNIHELPTEIGMLKKLKRLNISENILDTIPDSLKQLEQLEFICLDINDINLLPAIIKAQPDFELEPVEPEILDYVEHFWDTVISRLDKNDYPSSLFYLLIEEQNRHSWRYRFNERQYDIKLYKPKY